MKLFPRGIWGDLQGLFDDSGVPLRAFWFFIFHMDDSVSPNVDAWLCRSPFPISVDWPKSTLSLRKPQRVTGALTNTNSNLSALEQQPSDEYDYRRILHV